MKHPIEEFDINPSLRGMAEMHPPVRYSAAHEDCLAYLITPWKAANAPAQRRPLILFVQGSGWTHANVWMEMPQLSLLARAGYVVASVLHRNAKEGHPFPAYLQDVKTALRFLRAHAAEYDIDPDRVCVWGTSSGGNTALLMGLTAGDPRFMTAEYAEESDAAQAIVDCFGPTDVPSFIDIGDPRAMENELVRGLVGQNDPMEVGLGMSPPQYVRAGEPYPPFFILHGDADPVVPYEQSAVMAEMLDAAGADVVLARVRGGIHEGNFWSDVLLERIFRWIGEKI